MHNHADDNHLDLNELEAMGYEPSDIAAEKAGRPTLIFVISCLATFFVAGLFFFALNPGMVAVGRQQEMPSFRRMPAEPYPLLQSNRTAEKDMHDMKQSATKAMNGYNVVDQEKGMVSIPIDKAMEKALAEGVYQSSPNAREVQQLP